MAAQLSAMKGRRARGPPKWQHHIIKVTSGDSPLRDVNIHELQKRLNEAMQKLSEEHRAAVTMFDIQGMPHAEIAKILGISEGTVRSRLFYAHRQLQNFLSEFH